MIKDKIERAEAYYKLSKNIKIGFEWLKNTDLENISDGKYLIDGEDVFANVQSYNTKEDAPFEAHRKYIDIQYMIDGAEIVEFSDYSNCNTIESYNNDKDIEFLNCKSSANKLSLNSKEFLILFPHDAHKPSLRIEESSLVKKAVVKVAI